MSKKIITICCSAAFYRHAAEIADELEAKGYKVIIPATANKMRETGDYNVEHYKSWYKNSKDFNIKRQRMDGHFAEVEKADAILIVNDEKKGVKGYIGPNGLMEMALAYYLKKPIFILNEVPKEESSDSTFSIYEEVYGMGNIILGGDLSKLKL